MYNKQNPTFKYIVNTYRIAQDFKEHNRKGTYITYVSKSFYGAILRSKQPIVRLDGDPVAISVRLKGRGGKGQTVTGVKIDLIPKSDSRIEKYGIDWDALPEVDIKVNSNAAGNIFLNKQPALLSAFFYKDREGSSVINFVEKQ